MSFHKAEGLSSKVVVPIQTIGALILVAEGEILNRMELVGQRSVA